MPQVRLPHLRPVTGQTTNVVWLIPLLPSAVLIRARPTGSHPCGANTPCGRVCLAALRSLGRLVGRQVWGYESSPAARFLRPHRPRPDYALRATPRPTGVDCPIRLRSSATNGRFQNDDFKFIIEKRGRSAICGGGWESRHFQLSTCNFQLSPVCVLATLACIDSW